MSLEHSQVDRVDRLDIGDRRERSSPDDAQRVDPLDDDAERTAPVAAGGRVAVGTAGNHHCHQVRRFQHVASDGLQLVGLVLMDTMIEEADQVRGQ